jgi:hypothetical protein
MRICTVHARLEFAAQRKPKQTSAALAAKAKEEFQRNLDNVKDSEQAAK